MSEKQFVQLSDVQKRQILYNWANVQKKFAQLGENSLLSSTNVQKQFAQL